MRLFDLHSHWGTRRGYVLQTEAQLAQQKNTWNSEPRYETEEEMADYFRRHQVRTILDLGFTKHMPIAQVREFHDYAMEVQRQHRDVIFGLWLQIDPRTGEDGVAEVRRCIEQSAGFIGYCVTGTGYGHAASDPIYDPFYKLSIQTRRPVLVLVGHTGAGAGLPGGAGYELELCHPRYIDRLSIRHPELTIIAGRPAWPWQDEMISVMLHKPNVYNELHGWSPKYFTESLRHDIARRLKSRVMFGADYPLFRYERLVSDWKALGYNDEILAGVFHRNAEALFADFLSSAPA